MQWSFWTRCLSASLMPRAALLCSLRYVMTQITPVWPSLQRSKPLCRTGIRRAKCRQQDSLARCLSHALSRQPLSRSGHMQQMWSGLARAAAPACTQQQIAWQNGSAVMSKTAHRITSHTTVAGPKLTATLLRGRTVFRSDLSTQKLAAMPFSPGRACNRLAQTPSKTDNHCKNLAKRQVQSIFFAITAIATDQLLQKVLCYQSVP